jgi:hypothetical protein
MLRILDGEMFFLCTHLGITREDSDDAANENVELPPFNTNKNLQGKPILHIIPNGNFTYFHKLINWNTFSILVDDMLETQIW